MASSPVVVTGISPSNSSLIRGHSGQLTCHVKSKQEVPHIKWLKQVSRDAKVTSEANIVKVKGNRYQILPTAKDLKVSIDEYINVLALEDVTEADNGTYICFVANNDLNSLTFKSAQLHIISGILKNILIFNCDILIMLRLCGIIKFDSFEEARPAKW
jgi:hypothetical protein